jgi:hypothetical protein
MYKSSLAAALLFGISGVCSAADDSQQPPLKYTLVIDGQQHALVLEQPLQIQGSFKNPTIALEASSVRTFTYGGISFQYPAAFSWEAEIEAGNEKTWTLSGNDFTIMYFIQPQPNSADAYAQAMAKQFGKGTTRIGDTERTLGGRKYPGKLLFVKLAGTALTLEVYALPAKTGSRLLVLQDSPPDNQAVSNEGEKALAMLAKTFQDKVTPH